MASDDSEPAKLTEEMKSEGTEEEPIDNMVKPVDTVSPEDVQTEYEEVKPVEDTTYIETAKVELKALLLAHHAAIKDLKKQVNGMHRKLVTVESRKPAAKAKARKTTSMGSKKKTSQTKSRRR